MITKIKQNNDVIKYLEQDKYINLNILGYLNYNKSADVFLFDGDIRSSGVIVGCEKNEDLFFLATHNIDFLRGFWEMLPKGEKCFSGVLKSITDLFSKDKELIWDSPCEAYALKGDGFERFKNSEYIVEELTAEDAKEVDDYYTYKYEGSLSRLSESITLRDSSCVRINGKLAGWSCVHAEDDSMGPLYVKEEYRGLGLAKIISSDLMEKLISKGMIPYVQISDKNDPSLSLIKKFKGMEYTHNCSWFGIEK
jgi:hypothetical protein